MPWCDPCGRYFTPNSLDAEGRCPVCHTPAQQGSMAERPDEEHRREDQAKIPWHFWLLLAAAVIYLGWRAIQGIALLF